MKRNKKLALFTLIVLCVVSCVLGLVACGGNAKEAIALYLLPQDETIVDADFTLPKKIGDGVKVKWKSDDETAIKIEEGDKEKYNAKVTLQDEIKTVKLTISAGKNTKDFTVRVSDLTVYTFLDKYEFAQKNTAVKADFDLDATMKFQDKEATITWELDAEPDVAHLNDEKTKVIVEPVSEIVPVSISATFAYGGETATQAYPFNIAPPYEAHQTIHRMYSVAGYPVEFSGYIVHVYSKGEDYGGNATFYAIDDDFCSGYYFYQSGLNVSQLDKFVDGAHFTFSGDVSKNYNGLWEINGGEAGKAVVDDKEPINPREHVFALDTDMLAETPSLIWHQSMLVSLSGWKVVDKAASKPSSAGSTLFYLQKGEKKVAVYVSKYTSTEDNYASLFDLYDAVENDEIVNVTGLLGNYTASGKRVEDSYQIMPLLSTDVTKAEAEVEYADAAKVKAAVAAVNAKVTENFGALLISAAEVTMPTSESDVTISYRLAGMNIKDTTVAIDGGKITVTPDVAKTSHDIEVTYSIGNYKSIFFFTIQSQKVTDRFIVETLAAELEDKGITDFNGPGQVDLPTPEDAMGATITWSVDGDPAPEWAKIASGKLTIAPMPAETTTLTLKATVTLREETEVATIEIKVETMEIPQMETPVAGREFYLAAMRNGRRLYVTGSTLDNGATGYLQTAENYNLAAHLTLEASGENWLIKLGGKYLEVNPYQNGDKISYNLRLVETATSGAVWEWDTALKIFKQKPVATETVTSTVSTGYYYIGNRDGNKFATLSPSAITYISGDNAAKVDVTQHPARFFAPEFLSNEAPKTGEYILSAIYKGTRRYVKETTVSGGKNYFATTDNIAEATKLTIATVEGGYTIKIGDKFVEVKSGALSFVDEQTENAVWTWNADMYLFTFKEGNDTYYMGTYDSSKYTTFGVSKITYIWNTTDDVALDVLDVSQHPARFGTAAVTE